MRNFLRNLIVIIVITMLVPCFVIAQTNLEMTDEIQTFVLPNGQKLIVKEVHDNPIVTIDTWVRTGSINENDENNGVAHFLEHLMFKGTDKYPPGMIDEVIESKGAYFNAGTSKDYTHFYITVASEYFQEALKMHADMMVNANIPPEELKKERKVVIEEIRRAKDDPQRQVYYGLNELMFKNHPYRYDTLGTEEIISNIPRNDIMKFYKKWYVPSNMTTIIIGDVNTEEVMKLVEQSFGAQAADTMKSPEYDQEPPLKGVTYNIQEGDYKQVYLQIGFNAPSAQKIQKTYPLDVVAMVLGQGRSSRLYKRLVMDENLVNSVDVVNYTMKDTGLFVFDSSLKPENFDKVVSIIFEEIERIKKYPITEKELSRAKNQVERDFIYNNESVNSIARSIGYNVTIGKLENYTEYVEKLRAVTLSEVHQAADNCLNTNNMAISVLLPDSSVEKLKDSVHNITKFASVKPEAIKKSDKEKVSPEVFEKAYPNGMRLLVKPNAVNNVVSMNIYIKGGKRLQEIPGLSNFTANLLMKGTKARSAEELAHETESKGINIGVSTLADYIQISMKSTKEDFPEAFLILSDVVNNPAFPEDQIENVREAMINALKAVEDRPTSYSYQQLLENIYQDHPYGDAGDKVKNALPSIKRDDIVHFYEKYFVPSNMVISVVGNVDHNQVQRYVEQVWDPEDKKQVDFVDKEVQKLENNLIVKIPKKNETAWISMGWLSGSMKTEDYPVLKIISYTLGGGLSSRLYKKLRKEKGYAYQIDCFYPSREQNSAFVMLIGTKPDFIGKVIEGFKAEADKLKTELMPEDELNKVKQKVVGQYALAHETNSQQAFYLGWYEAVGKGYKFDKVYPGLIKSVTAEQVQDVAKRVFSSSYVITIVAPEESMVNVEDE